MELSKRPTNCVTALAHLALSSTQTKMPMYTLFPAIVACVPNNNNNPVSTLTIVLIIIWPLDVPPARRFSPRPRSLNSTRAVQNDGRLPPYTTVVVQTVYTIIFSTNAATAVASNAQYVCARSSLNRTILSISAPVKRRRSCRQ